MSWDPEYFLRQLLASVPGPRQWLPSGKRKNLSGRATTSYGCCPSCREFLAIKPADRAGNNQI